MTTYADAGVDINKANELVHSIKDLVAKTHDSTVMGGIGGFSGAVKLPNGQVLSMATDGVGTKLMIAQQAGIHNTVGIDLVAMSVNDLIVDGSAPIAFLDYLATGKLDNDVAYKIIEGVVEGCLQAECPLVGGETAELPGMYPEGEYDLAGFAVGHRQYDIDKGALKEGDIIMGIRSNGIHSNGYSLIRKVLMPGGNISELSEHQFNSAWKNDEGINLLSELLRPTMIYVKALKYLFEHIDIKGVAHITGGGLEENVPRMLGPGLAALVSVSKWDIPPIFKAIQAIGDVPLDDLRRTFNCGIGMVVVVDAKHSEAVGECLDEVGYDTVEIGSITQAEGDIQFTYIP